MTEVNGYKYDKDIFEEYTHRIKIKVEYLGEEYSLEVYTTDPDKKSVANVIDNHLSLGINYIGIEHWSTREDDDSCSQLIDQISDQVACTNSTCHGGYDYVYTNFKDSKWSNSSKCGVCGGTGYLKQVTTPSEVKVLSHKESNDILVAENSALRRQQEDLEEYCSELNEEILKQNKQIIKLQESTYENIEEWEFRHEKSYPDYANVWLNINSDIKKCPLYKDGIIDIPEDCPHGKPTLIVIDPQEAIYDLHKD